MSRTPSQRARYLPGEVNGAVPVYGKAKPTPTEFVLRYIERQGTFRGDSKDQFYRAAVKLAAADPGLELVDDPSRWRNEVRWGWLLRRVAR
jgi:hypothetical protein